jgi:hypothetical protein
MMTTDIATSVENADDFGQGEKGSAALWASEVSAAKKFMEKFHKSALRINERYIDKRKAEQDGEFRVNLFWSSIQVVMSMLYAQPPKADVKRLYDDFNDEPSRVGAEILERILNNDVQEDGSTSDASLRYAIQDWAILGLGQVWARYSVDTEREQYDAVTDPMTGVELSPAGEFERIVDEDAPLDYVHWEDFLYSPARIWEEVRWVGRRVYMTREQLVARFGEDIGKRVPINSNKNATNNRDGQKVALPKDPWQRAEVWEIWDKRTERVVWFCEGCDFLLDEREDPLQLEDFFPCPQPLIANATTIEMVPRSDYILAQDQFEQLDEINTRIGYLTRAMKVVGVYDKSAEGVQRMLSQAVENQLIPVDNWAMFAEGGGLKSKVDWMPVAEVATVIEKLVLLREQVKGQIYEVLGISDIMRGNTKASETLGAQQIKAQFGSTRVQLKQFYVAKFVQKALSIKAEIIGRHFQPQTIAQRSNIMASPDAQFAPAAIQLIKQPEISKYRVTVLADSLAYVDRKVENEQRTAALTAMGQFMQQAGSMIQSAPTATPMLLEMAKWFMAGFKGFQSIEGVFDQAINAAKQSLAGPKEPDPKEEVEVQRMLAEIEEKKAGAMQRRASAEKDLVDSMVALVPVGLPLPIPLPAVVGGGVPMPPRPPMPPMPGPGGMAPPGGPMPPQMPPGPPGPPAGMPPPMTPPVPGVPQP